MGTTRDEAAYMRGGPQALKRPPSVLPAPGKSLEELIRGASQQLCRVCAHGMWTKGDGDSRETYYCLRVGCVIERQVSVCSGFENAKT